MRGLMAAVAIILMIAAGLSFVGYLTTKDTRYAWWVYGLIGIAWLIGYAPGLIGYAPSTSYTRAPSDKELIQSAAGVLASEAKRLGPHAVVPHLTS